jgi:hypothetical protein
MIGFLRAQQAGETELLDLERIRVPVVLSIQFSEKDIIPRPDVTFGCPYQCIMYGARWRPLFAFDDG